jgi:hypothetical protein
LIHPRRRLLRLAAAASLAAAACAARADGLSAALEPGFTRSETDITDQAGRTTRERLDLLVQSYRLSLDRSFTERLAASVGGTFLDQRGWRDVDGVESRLRGRATSLAGRLTLALPDLTTGLGADRHEQRFLSTTSTAFVSENFSAYALWRPADLPELDLRVGRVNTYDASRRLQDTTSDSAVLGARFESRNYGARYLLSWSRGDDHLNRVESTAVDQTVLGTWNGTLFEGRTAAYASGTVTNRNLSTATQGTTGTVARPQAPVTGLSGVEALPATALDIALTPNPLLVDGNTTATAGVDVGSGPGALGDRNARDVGARFADLVTPVNTFYLWFDRRPAPEVGQALIGSLTVYRSDDNQRWTAVPLERPAVLSPFENRIELTTAQVQARFLKVAILPLAPGVTTDPSFRSLFVTELQFLLVLPASLVPPTQTTFAGSANVSARTTLVQGPDIAHDVQASVARQSQTSFTFYSVVNGLSIAQKLGETLAAAARVARQDQDAGRGHEGTFTWTASLTGTPYPTASWTLNYSGTATNRDASIGHSVTALARADLYEGISVQANGGGSIVSQRDRTARAGQGGGTLSLTPHRFVTVTTGLLYSRSVASSAETGDVLSEFARADASLSLTPAPALSASGTVTRVFLGARPTTLATLQLNYFPLRGDLQLAFAYSRTLDTSADATTENWGPSLRWNIRRGIAVTSSYTVLENAAPVQTLASRVAAVNLLVTL